MMNQGRGQVYQGEGTDTRVRTCNRAAPSDRPVTVAAGCGSSNVPKKDKNASVSFRCDSGLILARGEDRQAKCIGVLARCACRDDRDR